MYSQDFSKMTDATDELHAADRMFSGEIVMGPRIEAGFNRVMSPKPPKLETLLEESVDEGQLKHIDPYKYT